MPSKILISRYLPADVLESVRAQADVDYHDGEEALAKPSLMKRLHDREGLICHITDAVDDEVMAAAPRLRVISNVAVGFNNIDVGAAARRGIVVTNTPDVLTETTADFAWALLMATARRVVEADRFVRAGKWQKWDFSLLLGMDVYGKTLGVIGFGRIGRAVARRALGFNMRVLYHDVMRCPEPVERELKATYVDKETLLRESDYVTLHVLLSPDTLHCIDAAALRLMKRSAFLINASRGPVVDEAALVEALERKTIAAAGLDVFEEEPKVHPGLVKLDNVVLAPHIASASHDTRMSMAKLAADNCLAVLAGKPPLTPVS